MQREFAKFVSMVLSLTATYFVTTQSSWMLYTPKAPKELLEKFTHKQN